MPRRWQNSRRVSPLLWNSPSIRRMSSALRCLPMPPSSANSRGCSRWVRWTLTVDRRWINFESGLARGAKIRVLPLTIRGFQPGEVGLPLSQLHVRALVDELAVEGVVRAIADAAG